MHDLRTHTVAQHLDLVSGNELEPSLLAMARVLIVPRSVGKTGRRASCVVRATRTLDVRYSIVVPPRTLVGQLP